MQTPALDVQESLIEATYPPVGAKPDVEDVTGKRRQSVEKCG
ncbi:hypothetical protein [Candidatus Accumulibacter aalborgensis]|nr:hypothetical protein [Candidatus Accumulibacter aalborgensis]